MSHVFLKHLTKGLRVAIWYVRYLVKDLSRLTGVSSDRIRKWQQRYGIFHPTQGTNGYWYYSNEDYRLLLKLQQRLKKGEKLQEILGRDSGALLTPSYNRFSAEELEIIENVSENRFAPIAEKYEKLRSQMPFRSWIKYCLQPLVALIGNAWEEGLLSITDEHTFSRWFLGYLGQYQIASEKMPTVLVASFPEDEHELGAFMHNLVLKSYGISTRYIGMVERAHLLDEVRKTPYKSVHLSIVMPQTTKAITQIRNDLRSARATTKVLFGGWGYRKLRRQESIEREGKKIT